MEDLFMFHYRILSVLLFSLLLAPSLRADPLPNTKPLTDEGDLAAQMVEGIDKYLMRALTDSVKQRKQYWKPDFSSAEAYTKSVEPNRQRLRKILGVVDPRVPAKLEYISTSDTPALVAEGKDYKVYAVRWAVLDGVDAEGLLLEPKGKPVACVVAIPDADWTPEMLVGLAKGVPGEAQFARRLAENGCRVLVPTLIDRSDTYSGSTRVGRFTNQPHREFIYRQAFEMGRHIIGYEVQKVLAAVDWFTREKEHAPVGVVGCGEGGLLALYSGAVDPRIASTYVGGYFGPYEEMWKEPIYRNVWALLSEFGVAEIAALIQPRGLVIHQDQIPVVTGPPAPRAGRGGAAPGATFRAGMVIIGGEGHRVTQNFNQGEFLKEKRWNFSGTLNGTNGYLDDKQVDQFITYLTGRKEALKAGGNAPEDSRKSFDPAARQKRQFDQLCDFTQKLLHQSAAKRQQYWAKLNPQNFAKDPQKWDEGCKPYRDYFWEEVVGKLPAPTEQANPRTRLAYDEPKWKGYEVKLDLYPDIFAYGILLVPKDLKEGERRPVVVCQHGLEGRPQDVVNPKKRTPYYNSFGAQLADKGYIVYAPQNPYIGQDKFRVLQRKANPLKLSLFSFIIRQHERTLDWLAGLPYVDEKRIGFYGLSYGGKTAMRVPAVLPRYCLSICSGDFNEWVWKNVNLDWGGSYMFTGEYEMFEFDLGHTFNYAEMAMLIAPRPFMVERGHDDGVGLDEYVAFEYAKVRRGYAKLGIPDRTEIEFFSGGHECRCKGTVEFLAKHLKWKN
jgi:dienelactone hydrolase